MARLVAAECLNAVGTEAGEEDEEDRPAEVVVVAEAVVEDPVGEVARMSFSSLTDIPAYSSQKAKTVCW